jgi:hypothetical protein
MENMLLWIISFYQNAKLSRKINIDKQFHYQQNNAHKAFISYNGVKLSKNQ